MGEQQGFRIFERGTFLASLATILHLSVHCSAVVIFFVSNRSKWTISTQTSCCLRFEALIGDCLVNSYQWTAIYRW